MAGIIKTTLDKKTLSDLTVVKTVKVKAEPPLVEVTIDEVVVMLKNPAAFGGYGGIAKTSGASKAQVRRIHAMMKTRIAELTPAEEII